MKKAVLVVLILSICKVEGQNLSADRQGLAIADSLYATGNYTKAINFYSKEGTANASLQVARAYSAIGNYEMAIAQYEGVVAKELGLQIACLELGKLYLRTKQYDKARKLFTKLVDYDKSNPEYFYFQGEAFGQLDQEASSLVSYKKAISLDSTHLRSLFRLGKYFVVQQENLEALPYIDSGLEFYADDVALLNLKGLAHYNNNDYIQAIPAFERLKELGEQKEHIYLNLAYSYYKEWDFEKAKETYKELLELDDSVSNAYFGLGGVYMRTKQLDSAEISYKRAIAVQDPILNREYNALANIARERKDLKTALEYYKMAYEEDPSDAMAYYQVCTVADQYYKDPKVRLPYYENFLKKLNEEHSFFAETVVKRIRELKEEIHFADR